MMPPRIAALIEKYTNVGQLRVKLRGIDPEASAVLEDLRASAFSWAGSSSGTEGDRTEEPAASLKWLSSGQAAEVVGVSRRAIGKAIRSDRLAATKRFGRYEISREDLNHWQARRKTGAR